VDQVVEEVVQLVLQELVIFLQNNIVIQVLLHKVMMEVLVKDLLMIQEVVEVVLV
tara:strand:- start:75 stop:239 length:165 start_codon:yes stop_codon:yes gene_type:complete